MEKILVIADKDGGQDKALRRAVSLADSSTSITVLGFVYANLENALADIDNTLSEEKIQGLLMKERTAELQQSIDKLDSEAKITVKIVWERQIASWAAKYAAENNYDCIVKTGSRTESWAHTPVDWELFRLSSVPVLIVSGKSWKKKARVVACLDLGSKKERKHKLNSKVITEAQDMARVLNAEVHVAFALEVPVVLVDLDIVDKRQYVKKKREKIAPLIDKLCKTHDLKAENFHIKTGSAHRAIPSIANKLKADIVVVGASSHKGVLSKLGQSAEEVLSQLYTDIYVTK